MALRPPADLSKRGKDLWISINKVRPMGPGELILIHEAARMADRLDQLDLLLRGDASTWARVEFDGGKQRYTLVMDDALAEARQQANAMRQIILQLKLPIVEAKASGGSLSEQLDALRKARQAAG